jgi:hypothetical protein
MQRQLWWALDATLLLVVLQQALCNAKVELPASRLDYLLNIRRSTDLVKHCALQVGSDTACCKLHHCRC